MQNVLIVGGGAGGSAILRALLESDYLTVHGLVDIDLNAPAVQIAQEQEIKTANHFKEFEKSDVHIVFNVSGSNEVQLELQRHFPEKTVIIPGSIANIILKLLKEKEELYNRFSENSHKQEIIFNSVDEGMIGIDHNSRINFMNRSASRMLGVKPDDALGRHIHEFISMSELPRIYETGRTELNKELELKNGSRIVTSRFSNDRRKCRAYRCICCV